jgi:hypothetical protein
VILLHDVLDLVQVFLRKLIAVFKYGSYFVVYHVEGVEIIFLEMSLFGFVNQKRYFIGDFLVIFDRYFYPTVIHIDEFHKFKRNLAIFALKSRSDILVFAIFAYFFLFEISIGLWCVYGGTSLELLSSHAGHFFFLVLFLIQIIVLVLVIESDCLGERTVQITISLILIELVWMSVILCCFLTCVSLDMLHDLPQYLLL